MWILTTFGFFSVVQKPNDLTLTVRTRVGDDLDGLRSRYLPGLGPTLTHGGSDYPFRAKIGREELAHAMAEIVRDVTYSNFKDAVAGELGHPRSDLYHEVWASLRKLEKSAKPGSKATQPDTPPANKKACYGGVVLNASGRILLRKPHGEYDNYVWTFAKGGAEAGETPEQTALREVLDETGIEGRIVGQLPGWFESGLSATRFYVMEVVRDTGRFDGETSEVVWVDAAEAAERVSETRNAPGRQRDRKVLEALAVWRAGVR